MATLYPIDIRDTDITGPGQLRAVQADEQVPARDSVAAMSEPLDLVPRIRPLLHGGCSDILATIRHRRREHERRLAARAQAA